jgi:hypothetical protein
MIKGKTNRIFFSRLFEGEDLAEAIKKRVEESGIKAGFFLLIGSLEDAALGYYKSGQYKTIHLDGPLEIASCMGNIALDEKGELIIHAHMVVSNEKGEAFGGHLMKDSHVGATAELVIVEAEGVNLQRALDEKTGLKLLKLR